jgi:GT2 family glycosyltransferase
MGTDSQQQISLPLILSLNDEAFINAAYQSILGRAPDEDGKRHYLTQLRSGISKLEILGQFTSSQEGKNVKAIIPGLHKALRQLHLFKTPILGPLLRLLSNAEQSKVIKRLNITENKLYRIEVEHRAYVNELRLEIELLKAKLGNRNTQNQSTVDHARIDHFDDAWYLSQYPDVVTSGQSPQEHYCEHGKKDGRDSHFDAEWYLSQYPDIAAANIDPLTHYTTNGKFEGRYPAFNADWYMEKYSIVLENNMTPKEHYLNIGKPLGYQPAFSPYYSNKNDYTKWINEYDILTPEARTALTLELKSLKKQPLISLVMPVYNTNPNWLKLAIESVTAQIYPHWELCIADDASTNPEIKSILEDYAQKDKRIKVDFREKNGHISAASNSALSLATGEWLALLDHDDILAEHALYWVANAINSNTNSLLFYSDEDKIDENGRRSNPYFKCDWDQDLFYSQNLITHLGVYYTEIVKKISGFRVGYEGSQDHDLALRYIEQIQPEQIHHISKVLYHWRTHAASTAQSSEAKPYAAIAGTKAIAEHFKRTGGKAKVESTPYGYRAIYPLPKKQPLVSLIIPTRNGMDLLKQCIDSIITKTSYKNYEIIIVDNGSDDPHTIGYFNDLAASNKAIIIRDDSPFNYSALNNKAAKRANGEIIGLINNDIEVISPDWLNEMVSHAIRPEVGCVGAKLLYPDNTVQHAGVILGIGGVAGHQFKGAKRADSGYFSRAQLIQSLSAVTAACLLIRKSIFNEVSGLDEVNLGVAFNDVDFCIRVREAGYRNIWTPYAELYHHESASRGYENTPEKLARFNREVKYMLKKWGGLLDKDPAYNPNLTLNDEQYSLAWPPRTHKQELQ